MYKKRFLEDKLLRIAKQFKIVLIVGARQVGKSTLLSNTFPTYQHITFDPLQDLYGARKDPDLFLQSYPGPIILDEIQYVPELLPALKRKVDQSDAMGQYFLTGSQNIMVMKNISESLAGRVAILHLSGITPYEVAEKEFNETWLIKYLESPTTIQSQFKDILYLPESLFSAIWRGNYPATIDSNLEKLQLFFSSYIQTYIERDVRLFENIRDLEQFDTFLGLASALTAQEINFAQLGREVDITPAIAKRWLALLKHTYLWIETPAYSGNTIKRLSQKPKGYVTDTGLGCYLQRIASPDSLIRSFARGAMFESYCISLMQALCDNIGVPPRFYHWRTNGGAEVDVILERDGMLYPIEIKAASMVSLSDASGIKAFMQTYPNERIAPGLVLYAGDRCFYLAENIIALPWNTVCKK